MSLPASAPVGLTVATFRAGLARRAGAAAPALRLWLGRAAPGEYRSPFPARLRAARAAIVVLALLWLAAGFYGLNATGEIVRTVGHDTAPSVSSAEAIRTGVAAANADFALAMLSGAFTSVSHAQGNGADSPFLADMRLRLRSVRAALVEAARNITFGDEEAGPIATILQGLGEYEQTVGRADGTDGDTRSILAFKADDLLHWTVLPAAEALGRVNADHLADNYRNYGDRKVVAWAVVAAVLLVLALVAAQVDMARTAKRLLNPGLIAATLAVAAVTALLAWRLSAAQADLHVAKADAFDSVYALSTARALAADADAAQSFAILAAGDAARVRRRYDLFDSLAARLLPVPGEAAIRAAKAGHNPGGYLGDELANVTFDAQGEGRAATAAVQAWAAVMTIDRAVRAAEVRGDNATAIATETANTPSGAYFAFATFDAAVAKVLAINEAAFASAIASAEGDDAPLGAALVAGFVLAVAAAWFGIGRRLDEYRF